MITLSLSTAEHGASLALFRGDRLVCEEYWESRLTHSRRLTAMVESLVENRAGILLEGLDRFLAARGPGSFTGLRIGISVVKGLAYALDKPVAGISSLDGIAWRFSQVALPVCVMMDARRGEVYSAVYWFDKGNLLRKSPEMVCPPERAVQMADSPQVLFAGSGSKAYGEVIMALTKGEAAIAPIAQDYVSAAAMGYAALSDGTFFSNPDNELLPVYLRKSDAEIQFAEKT